MGENVTFQDYDPKMKALIKDTIAQEKIIKEFPIYIEELEELLKDERLNPEKVSKYLVGTNIPVPFSNATISNGTTTPSNKRKRGNSETDNSGFQVETLKGGTKVLVLADGKSVPTNHHIKEIIELFKPKILKLLEVAGKLKMFILFLIPKIEDGNNFGVQIQEDALEEIRHVESEAATYFDHFARYYLSRAKSVSKIAKYPHVDDFREALRELDERQLLDLKLSIKEMKNQYCAIYDLLMKNFSKIKQPKHDNAMSMF